MKNTTDKAIRGVSRAVNGLIRRMEIEYATLTDRQYGKIADWGVCKLAKERIKGLSDSRLSHTIQEDRIKKMRDGLQFIAEQGCQDKGDYASCKRKPNLCATEFCLPCFAEAILKSDTRDGEWADNRRGLKDTEA